jgi:putative DNA primase/helicase
VTIDAFLARLEGVTGSAPQWHARCPADDHEDRNASLSIGVGDDGRILLTCWRGCSLDAICAGAGVDVRDLFDSNGARPLSLAQAAESVALPTQRELTKYAERLQRDPALLDAAYEHKGWTAALLGALDVGKIGDRLAIPVRDASGALVNVLRYSVDGSRKPKMLAEKGHPRMPLYLLVDDGPVLIVEGEADAISVAAVGLSAIGVPGVSAKARHEWLEPVRERTLIVCMDNDDPGRKASRRWAPVAHDVGREARVVEWSGKPDKYDVGELVRERRNDPATARRLLLELADGASVWTLSEQPAEHAPVQAPELAATSTSSSSQLLTITASTVPPRSVDWLWDGWLPLGMVSLLAGLPGLGKTTLALRIAADVTTGTLPGALESEPADVLIASLEDVIAARLVPMLMASGADLTRVHFVTCEALEQHLDLTRHVGELDALAEHHRARFLFVDPLVATMPAGEVSAHRDQDVRSVLAPLHVLAERRSLAALGSMHFSKSAADALLGVNGSIAFAGLARSLLIFGADPNDEQGEQSSKRILGHRKCNVGPRQRSREVFVVPASVQADGARIISTSSAELDDDSDVSADELVKVRDRTMPPVVVAQRWLRALLADGPHGVDEIRDLSEDAGHAWRTVERAKRELNVESYQEARKWWWKLPPELDDATDEDDDRGRWWDR